METTKPETKKQAAEREKSEACDRLREILKPGDTVYCILRSCSRSGMFRRVSLYAKTTDGMRWLDGYAAKALGEKLKDGVDGIGVSGCGMDAGFHLVYSLGYALWPEGFGCIGKGCQSNDHSNGDRDYTPHATDEERKGADGTLCSCHKEHWHQSGGYALRKEWL